MKSQSKTSKSVRSLLKVWFVLNQRERLWIGIILAIALIGLAARYMQMKRAKAEIYIPVGLENVEQGGEYE